MVPFVHVSSYIPDFICTPIYVCTWFQLCTYLRASMVSFAHVSMYVHGSHCSTGVVGFDADVETASSILVHHKATFWLALPVGRPCNLQYYDKGFMG